MSLPFPANVTATVYRGFDAGAPLPSPERVPALRDLAGRLVCDLETGRSGPGQPVFWTHVLYVEAKPQPADVRDPYAGEISGLNPPAVAAGDTVVIAGYPNPGFCCPFLVRLVQRAGQGHSQCLAVFLDRCRPTPGPCDGLRTPCCTQKFGLRLTAELANESNCACVAGTMYLDHQPDTGKWEGARTVCGRTLTLKFWCEAPGGGCNRFRLGGSWAGCTSDLTELGTPPTASPPCSCNPLSVVFHIVTPGDCCGSLVGGSVSVTVRQ